MHAGWRSFPMAALVAAFIVAGPGARAEAVDLELVFAADGSGSIDDEELRLQRQGWADALASQDVLLRIRSGVIGAIAVAYMEWGGPDSQVLIVDWHVIRDEAGARVFGEKLLAAPRGARGYNSISNAVDFSVRLVEGNAHEGTRKIIDVSGDGPNIGGRAMEDARADALRKGFTINALAIHGPTGHVRGPGGQPLAEYYRDAVIGGPGAFVEIADETRPFAMAAKRKLVTEIAGGPASRHAAGQSGK